MKIEDLTPSLFMERTDRPVLLVGYMNINDSDFNKKEANDDFLESLREICRNPILTRRSFHVCPICNLSFRDYSDKYDYGGIEVTDKNADILVEASDGTVFKAPAQIFHYVRDHDYAPPQRFVDAVMRSDHRDMSWYAD